MDRLFSYFGVLSSVCACVGVLPQIVKIIRVGNANAFSNYSVVLWSVGAISGLSYILYFGLWELLIGNLFSELYVGVIVFYKLRERA